MSYNKMTSIVSSYSHEDLVIFSTFNDGMVYVCDFNGKILKIYQFSEKDEFQNTPFFSIDSESGSNVIITTYESRYILSGSDLLKLEFTPNKLGSNINSVLGDILALGIGDIIKNGNILYSMEEYYPEFLIRYKGETNTHFINNKIYSIWRPYEGNNPGKIIDIDDKCTIEIPVKINGGCFLGNSFIAFMHTVQKTTLYKLSGCNVETIEIIEHPEDDDIFPYPGIISDYGSCVFTYKDKVILFSNENEYTKCDNDVECTIVLTQYGPYGLCFVAGEVKLNKILH